jgi:AIR synthase-related protein
LNKNLSLKALTTSILESPEIAAKQSIQHISTLFNPDDDLHSRYASPGDDCAAFFNGNSYDLLASEGIQTEFLQSDPWRAGWSAVMANVSDISAMGGTPLGIVSTLWHNDPQTAKSISEGIQKACEVFDIHYGGGHLNISSISQPNLSVAINGKANNLLSCWHVEPEMTVYALTNQVGHWQGNNKYWNCLSKRSPENIRSDWHLPNFIANNNMASAAKDISNAGFIGTLIMMMELTESGLDISLDAIKPPQDVDLVDWLRAFQSYGFIFCCTKEQGEKLTRFFANRPLTLHNIGLVRKDADIHLHWKGDRETIWQFDKQPLTGLSQKESELG